MSAIFDLLSKRQKKAELAGQPAIYQYDDLPLPFRRQVVHILDNTLGSYQTPYWSTEPVSFTDVVWNTIYSVYIQEIGEFNLGAAVNNPYAQCTFHILNADTASVLDLIDLSFTVIHTNSDAIVSWKRIHRGIAEPDTAQDAIQTLNHRFQEHSIGYEFVEGAGLIKKSSQYTHTEIVEPAITLLYSLKFHGASDEFLNAHKYFRSGDFKQAITEACKGFESTIKTICNERSWAYPPTATSKTLIDTIISNGLLDKSFEAHFGALRVLLESTATVRNKQTGHGQGNTVTQIPEHLAAYIIHLTATAILFLVEAHKAKE